MDNQNDGLWRGGPWEQPSPAFPDPPAVRVPKGAYTSRRPVLRVRRKRKKWTWFLGLGALIAAVCLSILLLDRLLDRGPLLQAPFPYIGEDWQYEDTDRQSTAPPAIPRADTGSGVTVSLLPVHGEALDYVRIYERTAASAVSIESEHADGYSSGTGVILTQDGYLITNAHVVAGAQSVRVILHDNRALPASLVGFDAAEDLAVLKVDAQGLTPARFGDSNTLQVGEPVAALGDSLGYRVREVEVDGITMVLIQTSAAINFGNSGGPLINQYGQVMGINTIKIVTEDGSAEGLGFAIPSARIKYVADRLIAGEEVQTGVFGFTVNTVPVEGGGLELIDVEEDSGAWASGLRPGDILAAANGAPISGIEDLTLVKLGLGPGDTVSLTYLRNGERFTVDVALIAR